MANPESIAGRTIHGIQDRLQKAQKVRDYFVGPQSAEERLLAAITGANTPIARTTEFIISPDRVQSIVAKAELVRDWIMNHAPSYYEEPNSQREDEAGWTYTRGGFDMSADDITKPSSVETIFPLTIAETSPYEPTAQVWFSIQEDHRYNLEIRFMGRDGRGRERILQEYISDLKPFTEMPEEDAVIIEDLLVRVAAHLREQS